MGAGYTRQAQDNMVDGAVINSDDFNAEFNQLESAFNSTTGHTHDGTEGEGPKIDTAGLADDAVTPAKIDSSGTYEVAGLVVGGATLNASNLNILDGATLSTAELNILDGATVTTSELNKLDGATVEASELNILDGATITTTELNRLSGVTSNVQTQIDDIIAGTGGVTAVTAASPLNSSGGTTPEISLTGTVPVANGGTGQTGTPADGQLLIGNSNGFSRSSLTAGTGINITNGSGSITISADAASDVNLATDVTGTLPVSNGGTGNTSLNGIVRGNGTFPLTAGDVNLQSEVTGTLPVSRGGTGNSSHPNGEYLVGNGSGDITSQSSIPVEDISGLGSMATQSSSNVSITGGSISNVSLDGDDIDSISASKITTGNVASSVEFETGGGPTVDGNSTGCAFNSTANKYAMVATNTGNFQALGVAAVTSSNGALLVGSATNSFFTTFQTAAELCTGTNCLNGNGNMSVTGNIVATGTITPFTGSHICLIETPPAVGDILVDTGEVQNLNISNSVSTVAQSSSAEMKSVIGVFNELSGDPVLSQYAPENIFDNVVKDGKSYCAINSVGEGLINVVGENGNIEVGDLIVTSSTAGKGMKQSDDIVRNKTVAKAREAVTFASPTEERQIACIYMCG